MKEEAHKKSQSMPKIFISYKYREHKEYIGLIRKTLADTGFASWWDEENNVPSFRTMGLDNALRSGLEQADVIMFLIPQQQHKSTGGGRFLDSLDLMALALGTKYGENWIPVLLQYQFVWYQFVYGIDIKKKTNENWQDWERRIATCFGIPVVSIKIIDGEQEPVTNENDICILRSQMLDEDLRLKVTPQLISLSKEKHKLEVRTELKRAIRENMRLIKIIGAILLFYIAIYNAIETVKGAILWLTRKIGQFSHWMAKSISKVVHSLSNKP